MLPQFWGKLWRKCGQILSHTYTLVILPVFCVSYTYRGRSYCMWDFLFAAQFSCFRWYLPEFLTACSQLWLLHWKDLTLHTYSVKYLGHLIVHVLRGWFIKYAFTGTKSSKEYKAIIHMGYRSIAVYWYSDFFFLSARWQVCKMKILILI